MQARSLLSGLDIVTEILRGQPPKLDYWLGELCLAFTVLKHVRQLNEDNLSLKEEAYRSKAVKKSDRADRVNAPKKQLKAISIIEVRKMMQQAYKELPKELLRPCEIIHWFKQKTGRSFSQADATVFNRVLHEGVSKGEFIRSEKVDTVTGLLFRTYKVAEQSPGPNMGSPSNP